MERAGGTGSGPPSPRSHSGLQRPYLVPGVVVVLQCGPVRLDLGKQKAVTDGHSQAGPSGMARATGPASPRSPKPQDGCDY